MENIYLKPIHRKILDMLIMGKSREAIAGKFSIKIGTVNSYVRDMNSNNECNIYQLIWMYAQLGDRYIIKYI
jgi:hypothetical protein